MDVQVTALDVAGSIPDVGVATSVRRRAERGSQVKVGARNKLPPTALKPLKEYFLMCAWWASERGRAVHLRIG